MFQKLGVNELVPARRADRRNNENIRKKGNIFRFIQVFNFRIATGTRTRYDSMHLCSTDLVARDLYRHWSKNHIPLVTETNDIPVNILCYFF